MSEKSFLGHLNHHHRKWGPNIGAPDKAVNPEFKIELN
jgi:hypothetical protein